MLFRTRSFITSQNTSKTIKSSHSFARTLLARLETLGGTGENGEKIQQKVLSQDILSLHLMNNIPNFSNNSEVLTFSAFSHFIIFLII